MRIKEFISESAPRGLVENYAQELAQQVFDKHQDITSEDEVLNQAYHIVANDLGQKRARYMFNYDEDFPSDIVSTYSYLRNQGVAEDHEIQMADSELKSIYQNSRKLLKLIQHYSEQEGLEAWQQSKITKAADYLNSVLQSISGQQTR